MDTPKPGFYEDIPFETYKLWDAVNQSTLKEILNSPLHYHYLKNNPKATTAAMRLGIVLDAACFEPEDFGNRFHMHRKFDMRKTADKEEKEILIQKWGEENLITPETQEKCNILVRKISSHEKISKMLSIKAVAQPSIIWMDEDTGIMCKARLDKWIPSIYTIADLKSCRTAHPYKYVKHMLGLGGHFQAAYYLRGLHALDLFPKHFVHIVFESSAPHAIVDYEIPDQILTYGDKQVREALATLKECQETGNWPGYTGKMPVPGWLNSESSRDFIPEIEEF